MMSPASALMKWLGVIAARVRNQKALIWVSTAPLYGIGSFITTSNALIRSLATSKTVSSSTS